MCFLYICLLPVKKCELHLSGAKRNELFFKNRRIFPNTRNSLQHIVSVFAEKAATFCLYAENKIGRFVSKPPKV